MSKAREPPETAQLLDRDEMGGQQCSRNCNVCDCPETVEVHEHSHQTIINSPVEPVYKVYPIRWLGLIQLVLLNIVVSWDVRSIIHSVCRRAFSSILVSLLHPTYSSSIFYCVMLHSYN